MTGALTARILRQQRTLLVALALGVFLLELLLVHIAAAFGPTIQQMFETLPPIFRTFVGAQIKDLSLSGIVGFGFQHPGTFAMSFSLVVLTGSIPAGERESGLLDLLLSRPLTRAEYLRGVLWALFLGACLLPCAGWLGVATGLATVDAADKPALGAFLPCVVGFASLLLAWGGVTLALSTYGHRRGTAVARSVGALVVLYLIEMLSSLYAPLLGLARLSPFHYYRPIDALTGQSGWGNSALLMGVFVLATLHAFRRFGRRDL